MAHVFISYVRDDKEAVDRICHELRNRGVEVWLDRTSIRLGQRWKDAIREAIRDGGFFVACFSQAYSSKDASYMNEELTLAIDELRQKAFGKEWFIPILLSECDIPARSIGGGETLLDFQWLDLSNDFSSGLERLLLALKADEVAHLREWIDELGIAYVRRAAFPDESIAYTVGVPAARERYLEAVDRLRSKFGVLYDPIKIVK